MYIHIQSEKKLIIINASKLSALDADHQNVSDQCDCVSPFPPKTVQNSQYRFVNS